jgi:hypothetical protein
VKAENERFFQRLFRASGPLEERANLNPLRVAIAAAVPSDDREAALLRTATLVLALHARDPETISRVVDSEPRTRITHYGITYPKPWFAGLAARMRGDADGARVAFTAARAEMAQVVEADPASARMLSVLAMIDAALGRKEEAVREGERAHEMLPLKKSAVGWPVVATNLAVVYAWTDQPDQAIALLHELVKHPAAMSLTWQPTYGDLRLNPIWDPLRSDPRFEAVVEQLAPAAAR